MANTIDCLIIGHNDPDFRQYAETIRQMGIHSGAYRDLDLGFVLHNNKPYHASGLFNEIGFGHNRKDHPAQPLQYGETFSAAIAYLGTYLKRRGFNFDYINAFREEKKKLAEKLEKDHIIAIAITTTLYVSVFPIIEVVQFIKKYNRTAAIIVGGPFVATHAGVEDPQSLQFLFESIGADVYVNSSQGEATLVSIIKALKNHTPPDQIPNIFYRANGQNSQYIATPIKKENNRLAENMVDWSLFRDKSLEYVNLRTSISCPFSCAFCGFPQHAGKYQAAGPDHLEQELNTLCQINTVKSIHFIDDTFNVPPERFKKILRLMIKNNYGFKWHSQFRCQYSDQETVKLMKDSGCEGVFLGLESGNQQVLVNMNKAASVESYRKGIDLLKKYEIPAYGSFIIGFPGETRETVQDTFQLIEDSGLDFFRAQLWYCDPLTPVWKNRTHYNINGSHFEWQHRTMNCKTAADLVEELFKNVKHSTWVPQYRFDFDSLFHLIHRGLSIRQVKELLACFNRAVKEKLSSPSPGQIGHHTIKQLKQLLAIDNTSEPPPEKNWEEDTIDIDFELD